MDQPILITACAVTLVIGFGVYFTHRQRGANQQFLTLSIAVAAWLMSVLLVFRSTHPANAAFWIRCASASGAFFPVAFTLLRLSIVHPELSFRKTLLLSSRWLLAYGAIALYCFTPLYLAGAQIPKSGVPNAIQGSWPSAFPIYFVGAVGLVIIGLWRDVKKSSGVRKGELHFVLLGLTTFFGVGLLAAVVPLITHNSQSVPFAPLCIILMDSIIAYGIATKRMMGVSGVLRRGLSYGLLIVYLVAVYLIVERGARELFGFLAWPTSPIPQLFATLLVAFSISRGRVYNFLQVFVNRLFLNLHEINLAELLEKGESVLGAVTTTRDLLRRFTRMLCGAMGTDFAAVFFFDRKEVMVESSLPLTAGLQPGDPLSQYLERNRKPLLGSWIHRMKSSQDLMSAAGQLKAFQGEMALGIYFEDVLVGVVLLGERLSGRGYNRSEQDGLQMLINNLAQALQNARLYTEIQNAKVYNEILVDNLVSGVIAVNDDGKITVVNTEAQRILGLSSDQMLGQAVSVLPPAVGELLEVTLREQLPRREQEVIVEAAQARYTVQLGSSVFRNQEKELLGALVVLHDISEIKDLELQVHHSDRLATIGRLSATMAHEIKNPLVALKTFAQLLTERGNDPKFITSFSKIVISEVERINRTVTELLGYAKLGVNSFQPIHMHDVIRRAEGLLKPQLHKKHIQIATRLFADRDLIRADYDRFQQILVNLLLNASEAIEKEGNITITTASCFAIPAEEGAVPVPCVDLTIEDNGKGIAPEDLKRIFDPFFTTKNTGTGLGLSLTASLVTAHKGTMDVESHLGHGTIFRLKFPTLIESQL